MALSFALSPTASGAVTQSEAVWLSSKGVVVEVELIQNALVGLPEGAGGRPTEAAASYEIFGVAP